MHVAVVGPVPPPYQGMTVYTAMLREQLAVAGVEVRWIDSSDHRDLTNMGRIDWGNLSGAARTAFGILSASRLQRPRLLYLPIAQSALPFVRDAIHLTLGRLCGMRTVVHLHGGDFRTFYEGEPSLVRWIIRHTLDRCAAIIVLSPVLTAQFDGIVSRPRIAVVPNAVAEAVGSAVIEARLESIAERQVRVSFLAAITGPKGAVDFARAVELLSPETRRRASFVLAGNHDGNFEQDFGNVLDAVDRLAAAGTDITLTGVVDGDAKPAFFGETDVFVLPSHREGQPLVVLEALSAGCAVVSTRVGGIPETVTDGVDARLVDPGDVEGLASVIGELIEHPGAVAALGRSARQRWERDYRPAGHGEAMARLFEEVLGCTVR